MMTIARKILRENNLCVLATCNDNLPNCSLMQYLYDDSSMSIYMLTLSESVKYKNILANPQVSLLIDTRTDVKSMELPVMALTLYGKATTVSDPQMQQSFIDQMVNKYSNLAVLAGDNRCLVIQIHIENMLLLDGVRFINQQI